MQEYDRICDWYASARRPQIGLPDLAEFERPLAPGSRVLDLGCGTGVPISKFLIGSGFELFAIDSSEKIVARFHGAFPHVPVQCARIQDSDFFRTSFDAIVAWGVLFHLAPSDQEEAIARISRSLNPGGRFLFTSPKDAVTWEDTMDGQVFHCALSDRPAIYAPFAPIACDYWAGVG